MKLAKIDIECVNGKNWGYSVYPEICPYHCKRCFNSQLWTENKNDKNFSPIIVQNLCKKILNQNYITRLSILGGEPLLPQNMKDLNLLVSTVASLSKDIDIWLWTGTTFEDIQNLINGCKVEDTVFYSLGWTKEDISYLDNIIKNLDYLIDGRFIQEKKDLTLKFRGSSNQRIINVQKSLVQDKVILANI